MTWTLIAIGALIAWAICLANWVVACKRNRELTKKFEESVLSKCKEDGEKFELKLENRHLREDKTKLQGELEREKAKYQTDMMIAEMKYIASVKEQVKMAEKMEELVKKCEEQK